MRKIKKIGRKYDYIVINATKLFYEMFGFMELFGESCDCAFCQTSTEYIPLYDVQDDKFYLLCHNVEDRYSYLVRFAVRNGEVAYFLTDRQKISGFKSTKYDEKFLISFKDRVFHLVEDRISS